MKNKKPRWKRRIENDIMALRRDTSILASEKKEVKKERLDNLSKNITSRKRKLKQRLIANAKLKRNEQHVTKYKENNNFHQDKKRFSKELNGRVKNEDVLPNAEKRKKI